MVRRYTYPSIHFFVSRSRSVVDCAHVRAFTLKLSQDHGRLTGEHISEHSLFRLKITVGCLTSTCPSIRPSPMFWNSEDRSWLPDKHMPKHSHKNLHACWTPWSTWETARPPVLTPVPVPSHAIHSRACLNLHHCDIQSTAQKSPCVNTFLRPSSRKKKTETFLSLSGSLGRTHRTKTTDT